jgi:hypothetical protein
VVMKSPRRPVHADATYRVYRREDGAFGVEVRVPDAEPTHVARFTSRSKVNDWIEDHKSTVEKPVAANKGLPFFLRQSKRDEQ